MMPASRIGRWLAPAALTLVLLLAGVGWLQTRSLALLNGAVLYEGDNLLWSFYQLNTEYLRLRELLRLVAVESDPATAERRVVALQERYEIFVSRISLIEPARMRNVMTEIDGQMAMLQRLKTFVDHADTLIGRVGPRLTAAECNELLDRFEPMGEPLQNLVLGANRAYGEYANRRNEAVRDTNRISIALTVSLSLLTLVLASLLLRQVKSLERRRSELEALAASLQAARIEAEQASHAKSAFLANMSHELRTPFNGLLGMLSLLEGTRIDAEQADLLRTARDSGEHLVGILNDVLDLTRLDAGQLEIHAKPVDPAQLLRDIAVLMAPQARARGLTLVFDVSADLPALASMDAKRVRQIVFNLVGNALKFTEIGAVRVFATLRPGQIAGAAPEFELSVADTGIGMDGATLERLFQRFSQGDSSIQRRYGGTGLGLEISRTLARMMGGDIGVSSQPGRGSVFTLTLPLQVIEPGVATLPPSGAVARTAVVEVVANSVDEAAASTVAATVADVSSPTVQVDVPGPAIPPDSAPTTAPTSTSNSPSAAATATGPSPEGSHLRVLVCDDHPVNRKLLVAMLGRLGLAPVVCVNGAEAVDQVRQAPFDLVLMDMHMPVMDGLAATRAIRALSGLSHQPVVVAVTADAFAEAHQRAQEAGMDDVITKPLQLRDIKTCLNRHFGLATV